MSKINNIKLKLSDVINGDLGIVDYRFDLMELNGVEDVISCISELISRKLQNTGLNLNMLVSSSNKSNISVNMNVDDLAREISIYYLLEFVEDEQIDEVLIKDEIKFINDNFDLESIINNFSDVPSPKLIPVTDADITNIEDVYKLNKLAMENKLEEE